MRLYSVYLNNLTKRTKALTQIFIKGSVIFPVVYFLFPLKSL